MSPALAGRFFTTREVPGRGFECHVWEVELQSELAEAQACVGALGVRVSQQL